MVFRFRTKWTIWDGTKFAWQKLWKLGDGETIKFWKDHWSGNQPLMTSCHRLFDLCVFKDITLNQMCSMIKDSNASLRRRSLRNWELKELSSLTDLVNNVHNSNNKDQVIWKANSGIYSSSTGYKLLCESSRIHSNGWNLIWKCKVPPNVKIFLWKIKHSIIPTKTLLVERRFQINPTSSWCGMATED